MNVEFLSIATSELDDAFEYYEYQQQDLGYRFISEVESAVERIQFYPEAWHSLSIITRRCQAKI